MILCHTDAWFVDVSHPTLDHLHLRYVVLQIPVRLKVNVKELASCASPLLVLVFLTILAFLSTSHNCCFNGSLSFLLWSHEGRSVALLIFITLKSCNGASSDKKEVFFCVLILNATGCMQTLFF